MRPIPQRSQRSRFVEAPVRLPGFRHSDTAGKALFRSAKTVTGITSTRVTTDGGDSYPRANTKEVTKAAGYECVEH